MAQHKLRIYKGHYIRRWYVVCSCGWEPTERGPSGQYGRRRHDDALAVGVKHQVDEYRKGNLTIWLPHTNERPCRACQHMGALKKWVPSS